MQPVFRTFPTCEHPLARGISALALLSLSVSLTAVAQDRDNGHDAAFQPGNLVVSRSVYDNRSANVQVGSILPPGCAQTTGGCGAATGAPNDGTYPFVWNNALYDGSFGITSKIFLDQLAPSGWRITSISASL